MATHLVGAAMGTKDLQFAHAGLGRGMGLLGVAKALAMGGVVNRAKWQLKHFKLDPDTDSNH